MAIVAPFRAVRPTADKVAKVSTLPYEKYSTEELDAIRAQNPYSFLHIITAKNKIFLKKNTRKARYQSIRKCYQDFKRKDILFKDPEPYYYLYEIQNKTGTFCGLIAATNTADYEQNHIKKHEQTITAREKLFANYLKNVRFNAAPVLLTYPDHAGISALTKKYKKTVPEYAFSSTPEEHHQLWVITNSTDIAILQHAFASIPSLYIADGHHRCASSAVLSQILKKENNKNKYASSDPAYTYFMSYLIPESQLKIREFNRLIKGLYGLTPARFLKALKPHYEIMALDNHNLKQHEFSMYLDGSYYQLRLKQENYRFADAKSTLDTEILYRTILEPILGISDPRTDDRISYFHDNNAISLLKNKVDRGAYDVGFGMLPITTETLKIMADANLKMPPKSTYILPKLRSGLIVYEF